MKLLIILFFALTIFTISGNNCNSKSGILFESSFEQNNKSTFDSWEFTNKDAFKIVKDAPPNGGEFSLEAITIWGPPQKIIAKVKVPEGSNIYKLSFWGKFQKVQGKAWIGTNPENAFKSKSIVVNDTSWSKYSQVDTIQTNKSEYIYIALSSGFSELLSGATYFDLVKLELE